MARTGWHQANHIEDGRIVDDGRSQVVINPDHDGPAAMIRVYFLRDNGGPLDAIEIQLSREQLITLANDLIAEVDP
jgi:hypothetical protein